MPAPAASAQAEKGRRQLLALTGLRFLLAAWVIVFHQADPTTGYLGRWMQTVPSAVFHTVRVGFIAVQFFFVLSGFILAYNYSLQSRWTGADIWRFFGARFSRVYPSYVLGLALIAAFVLTPLAHNLHAVSVAKAGGILLLNLSLLQAWLPQTALSWNFPGWSLSDELFFYALFPFFGVFIWRRLTKIRFWFFSVGAYLLALAGPLIATSLGVGVSPGVGPASADWSNFFKFDPLFHLPAFILGIMAAWAYRRLCARGDPLSGRGYLLYIPAVALEFALIQGSDRLPLIFFHDGLLLPLHAALVLGLALGGGWGEKALAWRPVVFLGGASYLMYLLQIPLAQWMGLVEKHLFHAAPRGVVYAAFYLVVLVALSCLLFAYFENPAHRWLRSALNRGTARESSEKDGGNASRLRERYSA